MVLSLQFIFNKKERIILMQDKTILLVEDDFLNRRLSKKLLLENGYTVFEAKNTNEAIEILKKESITLAILDINLGENEKDGISLGQYIKDKYSLPFIYLTAYDNSDIIRSAVATFPYSYLTKPFKKSDLIASVEISIRQSVQRSNPKIVVKHDGYSVSLAIEDINYIESVGNYLLFHTNDKKYKSRSTIKQIVEELSDDIFVQVHRAYVVNKTKIEKHRITSIIVKGAEIPVSKNHMDKILFHG